MNLKLEDFLLCSFSPGEVSSYQRGVTTYPAPGCWLALWNYLLRGMKRDPTPAKWGIIFCLQCSYHAVCLWCWCLNSFPRIPPCYCLPVSLWQLITLLIDVLPSRVHLSVSNSLRPFSEFRKLSLLDFHFLKKICVWVFLLCVCLCTTCMQCLRRPEKGIMSPRTWVTDGY